MMLFKNDIKYAACALQLSVGQDAGVEAVVRAMHDIFPKENTDIVLLIDAKNAFNSMVILHNTKLLCPLISAYICNCYGTPARFRIFGRSEILYKEGTIRGDLTSKGPYALMIFFQQRNFKPKNLLLLMILQFLQNYQISKIYWIN